MEFIKRTHEEVFRRFWNFYFPADQITNPTQSEAMIEQSAQVEIGFPESGDTSSSKKAPQRQRNRIWTLLRNFQIFPASTFTDTKPFNQEKPIAEASASKVELESIVTDDDVVNKLNVDGGVERTTAGEHASTSSTTGGTPSFALVLLGKNGSDQNSVKVFLTLVCEAHQRTTILILCACAFVSLVVSLFNEGWRKGFYYNSLGLISIVASILLVVFVLATRNYRQHSILLFKDLDGEKKKINVQVTGEGCSHKISAYDVIGRHVVPLSAGDKVPTDGIFISGSSVVVNDIETLSPQVNFNGAAATIGAGQAGCSTSRDTSEDVPTTSSQMYSNDLIRVLVANLESPSIEEQKTAAKVIRKLTKDNSDNDRLKIAKAGATKPLISLLSSSDVKLQEDGVISILNLSLCEENRELIVSAKPFKPLVQLLDKGTLRAKRNAASALFHLSRGGDDEKHRKTSIGWLGAIPLLVRLLESRCIRGKKDAATALYCLCSVKDNKLRAVHAGIMKPLVKFVEDFDLDMVEKTVCVLSLLVSLQAAIAALVEQQGIPALVKIIERGWRRLKEITVAILLQICQDNEEYCSIVARRRRLIIPHLEPLSQFSDGTKQKAETLIELMSNPRFENTAARA
ncbi:hypothetical protein TIFTF001_044891 [Ficus carica]|uniref:U-box domain-containing protein n=1 Tax=Ficus carica TaxID=3494 RepID=A0AA88CWA5_FICCA|nr:hypothetical protein TIFTF001_044891 [Ficus carica]